MGQNLLTRGQLLRGLIRDSRFPVPASSESGSARRGFCSSLNTITSTFAVTLEIDMTPLCGHTFT